ncbi:MAG: porin family protein [Bacteroidota bacterium]
MGVSNRQVVKGLFAISLLWLLSFSAQAQLSLGFRSGISVSSFRVTPDAINIREIGGWEFAVPIEIRLNEWIALQPELGFSQRGVNYTRGSSLDGNRGFLSALSGRVSLNYLQTPFLIKFAPESYRAFSFQAFAGPSLGILLNARSEESFGLQSEDPPVTRTLDSGLAGGEIKNFDIGVVIGSGIAYRIRGRNLSKRYRGEILMDVRYTIGTTHLDPNWNPGNVSNRSLAITWGYRVDLGR